MKLLLDGELMPKTGDWLCFDCGHRHLGRHTEPIGVTHTTLPETDKAYIAGLIDGEGCISIAPKHKPGYYDVRLTISNTSKSLIEWAVTRIGGLFYADHWDYSRSNEPSSNRHPETWKLRSSLIFTSQKARAILHAVLPYLVIKRPQAELALSYFDLVRPSGYHIPEDLKLKRIAMCEQMHVLNKKGR